MKNIALAIIAVALLLASGVYTYSEVFKQTDSRVAARSQALKDCSSKIPDSETSEGRARPQASNNSYLSAIGPSDTTEYSLYPSFDRCMAGKGFWRE